MNKICVHEKKGLKTPRQSCRGVFAHTYIKNRDNASDLKPRFFSGYFDFVAEDGDESTDRQKNVHKYQKNVCFLKKGE